MDAPEAPYHQALAATASLRRQLPPPLQRPRIGIICGSGLGGLQHSVVQAFDAPRKEIEYKDVPGMPLPSVVGHEGKLVFGMMGATSKRVPVVLLVGRVHSYEGHPPATITFATRLLKCLDVETLIATNAAGGLNPSYRQGDIMLLSDHLNLAGLSGFHPLIGPNDDNIGPRFPPLSDAYDLGLRRRTHAMWKRMQQGQTHGRDAAEQKPSATESAIASGGSQEASRKGARTLHEGTYAFVSGPSFETRAEARMLHSLGADVVGMSTVPEVIVARHAGMRVLAASLVTNMVVLDKVLRGDVEEYAGLTDEEMKAVMSKGKADHEEVLDEGRKAAETMVELIKGVVDSIAEGDGAVAKTR